MSFNNKTVMELKKIAKFSGIDIGDAKKKVEILNIFEESHFTEEDYESLLNNTYEPPLQKEETKININDQTKSKVLMAMRHDRAVVTALGYRFTQEEPYILVDQKDAEIMKRKISHEIREASPEEVASFYGAK